jgi:RNA polymerase sigma-70 factor (ECF subfamily)
VRSTELVERYQTRLLNFIYRTIGDRERRKTGSRSLHQRVPHIHRFDRSKKFSTWVYTIASNLAKNELESVTQSAVLLPDDAQQLGRRGSTRCSSRT